MKKLLIAILFISASAHARFWPKGHEPKLKIHEESATGISQSDFNAVLDELQQAYGPIFAKQGKALYFSRLWSDPTINSDAQWKGNQCYIESYGGLARYPSVTKQMYMLVELHEIGHCLGGAPYFSNDPAMSVEGQADYYASGTGAKNMGFDPTAPGDGLAYVLAQLGGETKPSWPGPVLPAVQVLFEDHPDAQCRFDTYRFSHMKIQRPNCWYPGGAPTGHVQPSPEPQPMPQPMPMPDPQPQPMPQPCGCGGQPMPMPMPMPGPMPMPMPQPMPGPWPMPWPQFQPGHTYTIIVK